MSRRRQPGRILVGTSGYSYPHWRGTLYPEGLPRSRWLSRYASAFGTLELNATFYRLPTPAAVDGWREATPESFVFACKGSRFLTHMKRLKDTGAGLDRFFTPIGRLGSKLAVVLWQLPSRMRPDPERLAGFLDGLATASAALSTRIAHVFEFRHADWYTTEVCALLDRYGAGFCEHDLVDRPPPRRTGGLRYLRFHGATGRYAGRYGRAALAPVAAGLLQWARQGHDAYVYFNNDMHGHAVYDALDLAELTGAGPPRPLPPAEPEPTGAAAGRA